MNNEQLNELGKQILDASIEVHKQLGAGLLESVYELCLYKELCDRNISVQRQVYLPITYKNEILDANYRIDLLIAEEIIIELKAVDILLPVHEAQIITYLTPHLSRNYCSSLKVSHL